MSDLARRLARLFKANLGALLDTTDEEEHEALDSLSDDELLAELERRRAERVRRDHARVERESAEQAARVREAARGTEARSPKDPDAEARAWVERETARRAKASGSSSGARGRRPSGRPAGISQDTKLAQAYAALECPAGADLATVKRQYRQLLRKYHPDFHQGRPDKQRIATEITRRLTQAYDEIVQAFDAKSRSG